MPQYLVNPEIDAEWSYAEEQILIELKKYKHENGGQEPPAEHIIKLNRKLHPSKLNHSFYYVNGQLFCADTVAGQPVNGLTINELKSVYLTGGHSKVKYAKTKAGRFVKLRIERQADSCNSMKEYEAVRKLSIDVLRDKGELIGWMFKATPPYTRFFKSARNEAAPFPARKEVTTESKFYMLIEDVGLDFSLICDDLNPNQKAILGVLACKEVQRLHRLNIVHRDIKPDNFCVRISAVHPHDIWLRLIDFADSAKLEPGQTSGVAKVIYSHGYTSEEARNTKSHKSFFTKKTDLVALAVTLLHEALTITRGELFDLVKNKLLPKYTGAFSSYKSYSEADVKIELPQLIIQMRSKLSLELANYTCNNPHHYTQRPELYFFDTLHDVLEQCDETQLKCSIVTSIKQIIDGLKNKSCDAILAELDALFNKPAVFNDNDSKQVLIFLAREFTRAEVTSVSVSEIIVSIQNAMMETQMIFAPTQVADVQLEAQRITTAVKK